MSEPILELPDITVTRERITLPGCTVFLESVNCAYIEENTSTLPYIGWRFIRTAWNIFIVLIVIGALRNAYTPPEWLYNIEIVVNVLAFYGLPLLLLIGVSLWLPTRKRREYWVQVETTSGTTKVYTCNSRDKANQVLKAIEWATENPSPPVLPNVTLRT